MDRGACRATVRGATKSRTQLSDRAQLQRHLLRQASHWLFNFTPVVSTCCLFACLVFLQQLHKAK